MSIDTSDQVLSAIFRGDNVQYFVPNYQRDYSWTLEQVEELWDDILSSFQQNETDYFMGAIVFSKVTQERDKEHFNIIDGQQRLATLTILISVLSLVSNYFIEYKSQFSKHSL